MTVTKNIKSKKGRRSKEEYYKTKEPDNVHIEDMIIMLPISLNDLNFDINMDKQVEILAGEPSELSPYTPESSSIFSEIIIDPSVKVLQRVSEKPIVSEQCKEVYDLTLEISGTKSSICCWWCCHTFDSEPVFMPTNLVNEKYKVEGNFCSYSCCYTYMKSDAKLVQKIYLLNFMFRDETGKKGTILNHINPAPQRNVLQMFGGPMKITDFRCSPILKINRYPMSYTQSSIEKVTKKIVPKVYKVLPPSKKYKPTKVEIPNNSLSKILGISLINEI